MAKNIFQKKKRIAHFQNAVDHSKTAGENVNELPGCLDYVSSIIQNMDSNFNSIQSDYSKKHGKTRVTNNNLERSKHPASFSSDDVLPNPKTVKRKFSTSQKFPLMEKSQKILKQLKHNRRIPKPRAHLATLPESPVKVSSVNKKNKKIKSVSKSNNLYAKAVSKSNNPYAKAVSKSNNPYASNAKDSENSSLNLHGINNKNSSLNLHGINNNDSRSSKCNGSKEFQGITCNEGENVKHMSAYSLSNNLYNVDSKSNSNVKQNRGESTDETTDSEYEKFVKKNKRDLQQKIIKNQKQSVAESKASSKKSKIRVRSKTALDFVNSSSDDDDVFPHSRRVSARKKGRTTRKVSTDETDAGNVAVEEIDNEANKTILPQVENVCSVLHKADSMCDVAGMSDVMFQGISTNINKEATSESSHLIAIDVVSSDSKMPSTNSSLINDSLKLEKIEPNDTTQKLVIDLCDSDEDSLKAVCCEPAPVAVSMKEKQHSVNDLYNNCTNTLSEDLSLSVPKGKKNILINTPQQVKHSDSDDTDIEIVEVITRENKSMCMTDKAFNRRDSLKNDAVGSNVSEGHSQIFKTEKLGDIYAPKDVHIQNQNSGAHDSKCNAVYTTNICNELSQDGLLGQNQKALVNSKWKHLQVSSQDIIQGDDVPHKVLRQENISVDDIHILNPDQTPICDLSKIFHGSSAIEKIKHETPDIFNNSLKHVKYSVPNTEKVEMECGHHHQNHPQNLTVMDKRYTDFKNESVYEESQELKELDQVNKLHLIEKLKKELCTYHEIIRTEASVGASLKLLETRQAEKVNHIRSLVQKHFGKNNILGETIDKFIKEKSSNTALSEGKALYCYEKLSEDSPSEFSLTDLSRDTKDSTSKITETKPSFAGEAVYYSPSSSHFALSVAALGSSEIDKKPKIHDDVQNVEWPAATPKLESEVMRIRQTSSEYRSDEKQTLKLLRNRCNLCGKEAVVACQSCAKVFFCSHECGRKYWIDGHRNECCK